MQSIVSIPVAGIFFGWTFHTIWGFIASSASLGVIIGSIATAVAVLLPKQLDFITDLRKWAVVVAVIAFGYTAVLGKGYNNGLQVKQSEWNAAIQVEADKGEKAHDDAASSVPAVSADRSVYVGDPWNRDKRPDEQQSEGRAKGPVRWLERHRIFGGG